MSEAHIAAATPAGLLRRLGAMTSDTLVVMGLLLLASLPTVPLLKWLGARAMAPSEVGWGWVVCYWSWLLAIWAGFFGYFWTRSGQTVGMKAWRIRVERMDGGLLSWSGAIKRWVAAALPWLPCLVVLWISEQIHSSSLKNLGQGLLLLGVAGLLQMYFSPERRTWHDRVSASRIIMLPKL